MSRAFEELDRRPTPIGEISLRRRLEPSLQVDVFEVKLDDDFLMSSLFTAGEEALARIGLDVAEGDGLDVVVGGLGLGYTARAALADPRVGSVRVIDALDEVIDWHRRSLVPLGAELTEDARCELVHGNFFELAAQEGGLTSGSSPTVDVVLVDIDHSPRHLLDPRHAPFYDRDGLCRLAAQLPAGGVFALWSNDPPDDEFVDRLDADFRDAEAHLVTFPNFYTGGDATSTIYSAIRRDPTGAGPSATR